jgi:hypothetical protein
MRVLLKDESKIAALPAMKTERRSKPIAATPIRDGGK